MRPFKTLCAAALTLVVGCGRAELYQPDDASLDDRTTGPDVPVRPDAPVGPDRPVFPDVPVGPDVPVRPDVPIGPDVRDVPIFDDGPPVDCRTGLVCPSDVPVCRMDTGECVQCITDAQCGRGTLCRANRCVPTTDCRISESCPMERPVCRTDTGDCVQCITADQCAPGQRCVSNLCRPPCMINADCAPGLSCCTNACIDATSDNANCGGCGIACARGSVCLGSMCIPTGGCGGGPACSAGQTCCGDRCVDTTSDRSNCGSCGNTCLAGTLCIAGRCDICECAAGRVCCGAVRCLDPQTDNNNCGACGNACAPGQFCARGVCTRMPCRPGTADCDGNPANGCEVSVLDDPANCGGCGIACAPGGRCQMGTCSRPMGCAGGPMCATGQTCCADGCVDVNADLGHCGSCTNACPSPPNAVRTCTLGRCGIGSCVAGFGDCNRTPADGCEANLAADASNCGACGLACAAGQMCVAGACSMMSSGREGAFMPTVNPTFLTPGVHDFTTITVPAGVVVYLAGGGGESGLLDLRATGDVRIDGTIDVSGGPGGQSNITSRSTRQGRPGAGGFTGDPRTATPGPACEWVGGVSGGNGRGLVGTVGTCRTGSSSACITDPMTQMVFASAPAQFGGGAGVFSGYRAYGAGGGGYAGGAPGALGAPYPGELDCTGMTAGGGATGGRGGAAVGVYNGGNGTLGQTQCPGVRDGIPASYVGGGGGGSIGVAAAMDLPVSSTFQPGSGGGGGSADYLNRPAFGGTSGGGGGGGALRIWSQTQIVVNGRILANGGDGGDAYIGTNMAAGCDPQPGAAGGGGSGGVIYLKAPSVTTGPRALVSAAGGAGGFASLYSTGGAGGSGGPGRIRLSVGTGSCTLAGTFSPALVAGCALTPGAGVAGRAYIASYPN